MTALARLTMTAGAAALLAGSSGCRWTAGAREAHPGAEVYTAVEQAAG